MFNRLNLKSTMIIGNDMCSNNFLKVSSRILSKTLFGLFLIIPFCSAQASDWDNQKVQTPYGLISLSQPDPGQTVISVMLNKAVIFKDDTSHFDLFKLILNDTITGKSYILLEENIGEAGCSTQYRIIQLDGKDPIVSKEFGTCSDLAQASIINNGIQVKMPRINADSNELAVFEFVDGKLNQ